MPSARILLGLATGGGRLLQGPDEYTTRTSMYSFYIRDQWQATRNLTINFGTRYEYFPLPTRSDRGVERYNFDTNSIQIRCSFVVWATYLRIAARR